MTFYTTTALSPEQKMKVFRLWNKEYPAQLQFPDLKALQDYYYALGNPLHYFAVNEAMEIQGWALTFTREGEKWFALIISGDTQGRGIGSALLNRIKQEEKVLNGWVSDHDDYKKSDGTTYRSPLTFYLKNDFVICTDIRLETEQLSAVRIKWQAREITT